MYNVKQYRLIDQFLGKLKQEDRQFFFKGKTINPIRIFQLTKSFPQLQLKEEDVLLVYSSNGSIDEVDVLISSKRIHTSTSSLPLHLDSLNDPNVNKLLKNHVEVFKSLVEDLTLQNKEQKKNLDYFTNKFKEFVNQKEDSEKDYAINHGFLEILKDEGERIQDLVEDLNRNKHFSNVINTIVQKTDDAIEFKAEHVVLQDIIKVYNKIAVLHDTENEEATLRVKFLLAFLFEKLQGNDIISSLTIERINNFVTTQSFDKNIEIIQQASLFNLGNEFKNEFLLPLILKKLDNKHFTNSGAFLYRIASLIAKADGTISEEEKEALKEINNSVLHPKQKLQGVKQTEVDENETLDDVLDELHELIGLESIKIAIEELTNFLKVQKLREKEGLKTVNNSLHSVFMGPPGTGKTTVARLVSKIYKHLGYLEKGHLVETDRSGMVAGYVGQTALKVEEIINASLNGVLFIDEAYALAKENKQDFGNEAIEVLLKKMEDHRKELVVIVAGYPDEMKDFITSNPGLQSRFNRYFTFDHYKPSELIGIFELFCKKNDFVLTEDAREKLHFMFDKFYEKKDAHFGNARVARNLFEKIIEYQANRIVSITPITAAILKTIQEEDIPPINKTVEQYLQFQENE
ncbi:AAA family ATPase [Tenacibaculum xiamenense]|uniref:AAA family ATPase n=1 Tax=Tenacibaculum xiamenense TaxID=1261553 RepID=UPI003895B37C